MVLSAPNKTQLRVSIPHDLPKRPAIDANMLVTSRFSNSTVAARQGTPRGSYRTVWAFEGDLRYDSNTN